MMISNLSKTENTQEKTVSDSIGFLPYGRQWVDENDVAAVLSTLRSDWITQGPVIQRFEQAVSDQCGATYGVAMANGTAALHAACAAAGIGEGDQVITTPLSFVASANCVLYCGGTPVFSDVHSDTLTIDVSEIEKKLTAQTKALIIVDLSGHPCELDEIRALAHKHNLVVIEDAAHSLGAFYKGKPVGGISDMTVLSFHPVKHITTGEGGMVLTNNAEFAERLARFRTHGITRQREYFSEVDQGPWYYEMIDMGHNYRITDFQCALGLSQLEKLTMFVNGRREIARCYQEGLRELQEIRLPIELPTVRSSYHLFSIRLQLNQLKKTRREIFQELQDCGLGVNVHYIPIPWHPFYQKLGYQKKQWPVAEAAYEELISLPMWPAMSKNDVDRVIQSVKKVVAHSKK